MPPSFFATSGAATLFICAAFVVYQGHGRFEPESIQMALYDCTSVIVSAMGVLCVVIGSQEKSP